MPEIKRGVQTGQVQIGEILLSAYGNEDPFFEVDSVPQLVTSTAMARKRAELQKPHVEARLNRQGLSLLYWAPWPPSGLYTNTPVETVETLRGSKMRTFNALTDSIARFQREAISASAVATKRPSVFKRIIPPPAHRPEGDRRQRPPSTGRQPDRFRSLPS